MSKTKEQCMTIIAEKFDKIKTNVDSKSQILVLEKMIKEISDSEYGHLYSYDNKNNKLNFFNNGNLFNIDMESSILEEVLLSKQGFFDNNVLRHKKFNQKLDNILKIEIKSLLLVPIFDKSNEKIIGFLSAVNSLNKKQEFKRYDIRCLSFLNSCARKGIEHLDLDENIDLVDNKPLKVEKFFFTTEERDALLLKIEEKDKKIKLLEAEIDGRESKDKEVIVIDEILYQEEKKSDELKVILDFLTNEVTYLANEEHKIYLFLEIIKNSLHNKEQLNYINHTVDKSQLVHKLVNDLYRREKMPLLLEEFNLFQVIYDLSNMYGQTFREENITFNIFVDPKIPSLLISEMYKIKSLIIHLLNNVYGLTNEGGTVELSVNYLEEYELLDIEIIAIPHHEKNSIPALFQKNSISHSLTSADSGLGLSVSSNLINILGGKLKLSTLEDEKHSFLATIPVKKVKGVTQKSFFNTSVIKIAILMNEENRYTCQNIIRYCKSLGINEKDIFMFTNYKKINNIKFTHLFCFEDMLSKVDRPNNFSSIIILKYSTDRVEKEAFNHKNIYEFYINSYYGQEIQELFFPDTLLEKYTRKTLLTEDSFLNKFNKIIKKIKLS